MTHKTLRVGLISLVLAVAPIPVAPITFAAPGNGDGKLGTASLPSGSHVQGPPPTRATPAASAQMLTQAEIATKKSNRPDSSGALRSTGSNLPIAPLRLRPQATSVPQAGQLASTTLMRFRSTALAASQMATVDEPSVSTDGQVVFMTGNWYAAESIDSGQTFNYLNPYTEFPASYGGFCCDQQTIYDPGQNITVWLLQYRTDPSGNNEQRLTVARGKSGVGGNSWTYWDVTAQLAGFPSGDQLDYPKLEVDSTYLFQTTNVFTAADVYAGSLIFRFPLAQLASGGLVTFTFYLIGNTGTTIAPAPGAPSSMYFGRHLSNSQLRLYTWPDATTGPTFVDVTHSPFVSGPGATCTSPDGTNMCGFADSRVQAGWVAGGIIGFMWNAAQDVNFPYPYVAAVRINQSNLSLIDEPDVWNSSFAFQYPGIAVNGRGHLALTISYAGGGNYPGSELYVMDDLSGGLWQPAYGRLGSNGPPLSRWGDFLIVRAASGNLNSWVAGPFTLQGPCPSTSCANVEPRFVWFGRQRDDPFAPGAATPVGITGQIGQMISNTTVALFLGPSAFAGDYSADMNWGDGTTPSAGVISGSGTAMSITASHTFATAGTFTVTTTITDGSGSSTVATGPATIAGPPSAPSSVEAIAVPSGVSLTWSAPVSDGGSAILGYAVTPYNGSIAQQTVIFNSSTTTQVLVGLAFNVPFTFTVAAFNSVGTGPQSAMSNVISIREPAFQSSPGTAPSRDPANQVPSSAPTPSPRIPVGTAPTRSSETGAQSRSNSTHPDSAAPSPDASSLSVGSATGMTLDSIQELLILRALFAML